MQGSHLSIFPWKFSIRPSCANTTGARHRSGSTAGIGGSATSARASQNTMTSCHAVSAMGTIHCAVAENHQSNLENRMRDNQEGFIESTQWALQPHQTGPNMRNFMKAALQFGDYTGVRMAHAKELWRQCMILRFGSPSVSVVRRQEAWIRQFVQRAGKGNDREDTARARGSLWSWTCGTRQAPHPWPFDDSKQHVQASIVTDSHPWIQKDRTASRARSHAGTGRENEDETNPDARNGKH